MHPLSLGRGGGEGHPHILRESPGLEEVWECREGKEGSTR